MNTRILLLAVSIASLSSCSSVYKSGQTPDDVYYSAAPARIQAQGDDSYLDVNHQKNGTNNYQTYDQYQDSYRDDRFLRMSVSDPYYMSAYNSYSGFDWRYNAYYSGFNYGFNSPWNNYFAWNNFYNPYGSYGYGAYGYGTGGYYNYHTGGYGVGTSYTTPISRPVVFNVNSYSNSNRANSRGYMNSNNYNNYNNTNRYNNSNANSNGRSSYYNNSNSNNSRNSYTPANSNSNNNSYTPSRSYTPSSSGSSSSGSSGGGGGGSVSRPGRGN